MISVKGKVILVIEKAVAVSEKCSMSVKNDLGQSLSDFCGCKSKSGPMKKGTLRTIGTVLLYVYII